MINHRTELDIFCVFVFLCSTLDDTRSFWKLWKNDRNNTLVEEEVEEKENGAGVRDKKEKEKEVRELDGKGRRHIGEEEWEEGGRRRKIGGGGT